VGENLPSNERLDELRVGYVHVAAAIAILRKFRTPLNVDDLAEQHGVKVESHFARGDRFGVSLAIDRSDPFHRPA
jgi:hypothetical protein